MLMLLHIMAYFPCQGAEEKSQTSIDFISLLCAEVKKLNNHIVAREKEPFENHNRMNSFVLCPLPFERIFRHHNWKNEEAEKSHKISGKNNFLCFDIDDDDAWLNVYVIAIQSEA